MDYALLTRIEASLYRHAGGPTAFNRDIPALLRQAIDEVIDTPRSRRFLVSELEKTEKTYIGTKVEILLRNHLGLEQGNVLDLLIDDVEVDVKNTIKVTWTIPNEALGHPCILISANEETAKCSFGLIRIREDILNAGRNRDRKTTIKKEELRNNALWMLFDAPYPENFWQPESNHGSTWRDGASGKAFRALPTQTNLPDTRDSSWPTSGSHKASSQKWRSQRPLS